MASSVVRSHRRVLRVYARPRFVLMRAFRLMPCWSSRRIVSTASLAFMTTWKWSIAQRALGMAFPMLFWNGRYMSEHTHRTFSRSGMFMKYSVRVF